MKEKMQNKIWFKIVLAVFCTALLFAFSFMTLTACSDSGNGGDSIWEDVEGDDPADDEQGEGETPADEQTMYTFEVEYVDLTGKFGSGYSNSAREQQMILQDTADLGASNGYYIPYTHTAGLSFTFTIESDKAATGRLFIRLASDMGDMTLSPDMFSITFNGEEVNYGSFSLNGADTLGVCGTFESYVALRSADIVAGTNTVVLTVLENDKFPGRGSTYGPAIDCIGIRTDATLTWEPVTSNIAA